MASFSKYTSRRINQVLGRSGRVWEKGFYDREIRSKDELSRQLQYIWENPVRKCYVEEPADWPFCEICPQW